MARQMTKRGNAAETIISEENAKPSNKSQAGLKDSETRATMVFTVEQLETLKDWAYTTRRPIKEIAQEMAQRYIDEVVNKDELLHRPN